MIACLQKRIGRTTNIGSFFDLVRQWSLELRPVAAEPLSRYQTECGCNCEFVTRVNRIYIVTCASHSEAATAAMGEALASGEAVVLA
jgi:hypothetical protein